MSATAGEERVTVIGYVGLAESAKSAERWKARETGNAAHRVSFVSCTSSDVVGKEVQIVLRVQCDGVIRDAEGSTYPKRFGLVRSP